MALSEMAIRHARITGNDYTLGDSNGLTLNVTSSGGKVWLFRYYWAGKQKCMFLGCYPQISLKEARTRFDEPRAWLSKASILTSTVNSSAVLFVLRQRMLDLWARQWRQRHAHGDVIVVCYADDSVVGFRR